MSEKKLLSDGITVSYTGLFQMKVVEKLIRTALSKHHYDIQTPNHFMSASESGKDHTIKYDCKKRLTEYDVISLQVTCQFTNMRTVTLAQDPHEAKGQKGTITITFTAHRISHREGLFQKNRGGLAFQNQAINQFKHILFSKFIKKSKYDLAGLDVDDELRDMQDYLSTRLQKQTHVEVERA